MLNFFTFIYCLNEMFNSPQSFVSFVNSFLLPSVEVKTKYLLPMFSSIYPSGLTMIRYNGFTLLIFSFFLLQFIHYCKCQCFCTIFCKFESKSLTLIISLKNVICPIFNNNLLNISHLYVRQSCIQ